MAIMVQQQQQTSPAHAYGRIPDWLRDLAFVTDFFSWLFALCSRLAEPLMLLCTLYIVAEAGVPAIALPGLHNLAIGIMITAPEIILPGSFVVASRAHEHARLLFAVCWTFVGLTFLTLISLFVWHFTGASLAWLMCARCAAAVGYSILMRVMNHGQAVQSAHKVEQAHAVQLDTLTKNHAVQLDTLRREMDTAHTAQLDTLAREHRQQLDTLEATWGERLEASTRELTAAFQVKLDASRMDTAHASTPSKLDTRTVRRLSIVNGPTIELDTPEGGHRDQIHALLREDNTLSARALAARVGCSPTTAGKWKSAWSRQSG
jgi:hypothetical protein